MDRDMLWRWDHVLKTHPNGMRFACFGEEGELLAVNEYYRYVPSLGGYFWSLGAELELVLEEVSSLMRKRKVR